MNPLLSWQDYLRIFEKETVSIRSRFLDMRYNAFNPSRSALESSEPTAFCAPSLWDRCRMHRWSLDESSCYFGKRVAMKMCCIGVVQRDES